MVETGTRQPKTNMSLYLMATLVVTFVSFFLMLVGNTSRYKVNRLRYLHEVKAAVFVLSAACFNCHFIEKHVDGM
jgi:hypothetical protein